MKPTLLILAAGMGSRYGGLKQIEDVGPCGETIVEYSIYDAIQAGFGKVVFVIRKSFEQVFKQQFGGKFEPLIEVEYAYQEVNIKMQGIPALAERTKPWGVLHAVLCAEQYITAPFAMINADDYYGKTAFLKMSEFLRSDCSSHHYAMIGYELKNTLSKNGTVTRAICEVQNGYLKNAKECKEISQVNGNVFCLHDDEKIELNKNDLVSMNFWGFHADFFGLASKVFRKFVEENLSNSKAELVIAEAINPLLKTGKIKILALPTHNQWFGITYKADKRMVVDALSELTINKQYPSPLW